MGQALDSGATVMCMHGGTATPTMPDPRVKVGGSPVTTQSAPWTVAGCPFTPGPSPVPCVTASFVTASLRVKAGGVPILLSDSQAVCAPNGTGVNVVVTQMRVKAQ
jgi:hypothetical protein